MNVFVNPKRQLRAGWRIMIWIVFFFIASFPVALLSPVVVAAFGKGAPLTEAAIKFAVTVVAVVVSLILLTYLDKRPFASMGLTFHRRALSELTKGLAVGFGMLCLAVGIMWALGHHDLTWPEEQTEYFLTGFLINALLFIVVGFNEEIIFRGYVFQSMIEGTNFWVATLFWSLLFGFAHGANPNVSPFGIANIVLAGILLSLAYYQTRSLWMPIGIHITWNFTEGWVWGLPVSGTTVTQTLTKGLETGPDWWTGGTFGPEGGAACTLVCALACFVIWKFVRPTDEMKRLVDDAIATPAFPEKAASSETSPG
jgi:hypothetical protein